MTRTFERQKALSLRAEGKSYSEIKLLLGISKSTLSGWLKHMPLSPAQIRKLQALNPRRIENFRETMRKKREAHLEEAYKKARADIRSLSRRDIFIAGLYLYWGEGTKSAPSKISVANTDPDLVKAFLDWLLLMQVPRNRIRARLHLYKDMDVKKETKFWSTTLDLPVAQFRKPHIKNSKRVDQTYKAVYSHGTCDLTFDNMPMWRYISMALKRLRELHDRL